MYDTAHSWNWLICIGVSLIDAVDGSLEARELRGFYEQIKSMQLRWRGKAAIFSMKHQVVAHPLFETELIGNIPGAVDIIECGDGVCEFSDSLDRKWIAGVITFQPRSWIITVFAQEQEILIHYDEFRKEMLLGATVVFILFTSLQIYLLRRLILRIYRSKRRDISFFHWDCHLFP